MVYLRNVARCFGKRLGLVIFFTTIPFLVEAEAADFKPVSPEGLGEKDDTGVWCLFSASRGVFAGTWNTAKGGGVFWAADGKKWKRIAEPGFGNPRNFCVTGIGEYRGYLYVGTWNTETGAQLYRSDLKDEPVKWEVITTDGFGQSTSESISHLWVFDDTLYAACADYAQGAQIWCSNTGAPSDWSRVKTEDWMAPATSDITSVCVLENQFLVGTESLLPPANGGEIRRVVKGHAGESWQLLNEPGFGKRTNQHIGGLAVLEGRVYATTWNGASGFEIWRAPLTEKAPLADWECVAKDGITNPLFSTATSLVVSEGTLVVGVRGRFLHEGELYAPGVKVTQAVGGALFVSADGTRWQEIRQDGVTHEPILGVQCLTVYDGRVLLGTFSLTEPARVWALTLSK